MGKKFGIFIFKMYFLLIQVSSMVKFLLFLQK